MIKANELRIGNWLYYRGGYAYTPKKVSLITHVHGGVGFDGDEGLPFDLRHWIVEPIPLSHEILEECGFVKCENGTQIRIFEGYVFINSLFSGLHLTLEIDGNRMPLKQIKYLHQLQNLYYCLTGEELPVSL